MDSLTYVYVIAMLGVYQSVDEFQKKFATDQANGITSSDDYVTYVICPTTALDEEIAKLVGRGIAFSNDFSAEETMSFITSIPSGDDYRDWKDHY